MDTQDYREHVETQVLAQDYEPVPPEEANPFTPVWYKQDDDPTIGRTKVFVTVNDDPSLDVETLETTAESFRTLVTSASPSTETSVENRFGYIVFALENPTDDVIEFATEDFTVADRRSNVFPLVYDLTSDTLHTHNVPRLKGRGFYEKQKLDAEELLTPSAD
ncbi:hypothetical protein EGH24_07110 [Halonotius terrestris]|uniref:Uncharacterized protein n=1 Tax=Halonotius terrestris TaxID=2487750 RepID=A0A8J8TC81_9EURY|nr:hypothetical protein [Halonotius terrestris]TQQ80918.1 hypothetical protein EGH24_07110 [Halonotius terrestris]